MAELRGTCHCASAPPENVYSKVSINQKSWLWCRLHVVVEIVSSDNNGRKGVNT